MKMKNDFSQLVVGAKTPVPLGNGKMVPSINFDNAATTPPFVSVMKAINEFAPWYSSIHRGAGYKSRYSSEIYENGRQLVQDFVRSDKDNDVIIFTNNTTESVNLLSYVLSRHSHYDNVVLSTWMEHASNDLPWRNHFYVDYVDIDAAGRLCIDDLERKLIKYNGAVRIVSVTGAANVTGYVNPIHDIAAMVHHYSAKIMVDGAQLVPHVPVDMKPPHTPEHIDFLAFSAHKMYAPFGTGVLIGPKSDFERSDPMMRGGNAFRLYTHDQIQWSPPPKKDEAGSPNVMGVVALSAAIRTLSSLDMAKVFQYETALYDYAAERMRRIPGMRFYSDHGGDDTISIIPFNMEHIPHHIMAKILAGEAGISVRDGFFCAHPYCQRLLGLSPEEMEYFFIHEDTPLPGMVRLSMGLYNTFDEVNQLIATLSDISRNREFYMNKYNSPELRLGCSH